ncbi:MAG TPA: hypothetical protein DCE09_02645 [Thermoanaerobacter sp.]|nr:hypothetical protein [Thermoanaerobacter sp.]
MAKMVNVYNGCEIIARVQYNLSEMIEVLNWLIEQDTREKDKKIDEQTLEILSKEIIKIGINRSEKNG